MFSVNLGLAASLKGKVFLLRAEGTILGKHLKFSNVLKIFERPGEAMTDFQIVLCTCADREQGERIAHRLVELQLGRLRQYPARRAIDLPLARHGGICG